MRRTKIVNGIPTSYNWDASGNLIRETSYGISTYYYYNGNKLIGLSKMSTTYLVHDNQRGDIESITDPSNTIVSQSHFDPWGNQITHSGTFPQSFGYAGYYYDDETGLYYLKSRYYSPALGRFLTRDSIEYIKNTDSQTLNLYGYCGNDPVSKTDPTGYMTETIGKELLGLTGAVAAVMAMQAYLKKMNDEIARLKQRASGPSGVQYSLRATVSGEYGNVRGGTVHLNPGDVWKYGETTDPKDRYTDKWLKSCGLKMVPEVYGTQVEIKIAEKHKIYGYFFANGALPPGNKIFR